LLRVGDQKQRQPEDGGDKRIQDNCQLTIDEMVKRRKAEESSIEDYPMMIQAKRMRTNHLRVWATITASFFLYGCSDSPRPRLLAVGGIHLLEGLQCQLARVEPEGMVKDLEWTGPLALEARGEGQAEVVCGNERLVLQMVSPARLEIKLVDAAQPNDIAVDQRIVVRALLYDRQGRDLEVGKFTKFEWDSSENLIVANDRSSGESGFCDTCFGINRFRAVAPGKGSIIARLGSSRGGLTILVNS
jgi:hypothetical protein